MMGKKKPLPFLENVEILDAGSEGKAIARVDELVVFVPFVVPGDVVDVQVIKKKKKYLEGKAVKFHKYSDLRIDAFCEHFGVCGGCKWQSLPYDKQLFFKQKQVKDNLERLGRIDTSSMSPIMGSAKTTHYRNKLEFSFSNKKWLVDQNIEEQENGETMDMDGLGFHVPGRFDKVLDLNVCYLMDEPADAIRLAVRRLAKENDICFFDPR
ncbi:MAG: TRAM domain-containing protein, partial [Bacteroidales bacterium]|nr:TRAM domain-containing protein [Bacteroidales bacterium]